MKHGKKNFLKNQLRIKVENLNIEEINKSTAIAQLGEINELLGNFGTLKALELKRKTYKVARSITLCSFSRGFPRDYYGTHKLSEKEKFIIKEVLEDLKNFIE